MPRGPIPAELKPENITALIDSREQMPLDLSPLRMETLADGKGLPTGDYSVKGLTDFVVVERKSLEDLLCVVGRERERFEKEVQRLLAYPQRLLVIESGWLAIERGDWRSQVTASHPQESQAQHSQLAGPRSARAFFIRPRTGWPRCRRLPVHGSQRALARGARSVEPRT
jgi:hypothetical protein